MTDTPQVLLAHHLKTLKLPTFLREYDKLARQCATEGADHVRYLVRLTELELIDRERRMVERRIRQARFPAVNRLRPSLFSLSVNSALWVAVASVSVVFGFRSLFSSFRTCSRPTPCFSSSSATAVSNCSASMAACCSASGFTANRA